MRPAPSDVCAHGFRRECRLCHKHPEDCDYGACASPFSEIRALGQERRQVCVMHGFVLGRQGWARVERGSA